MPRNVEIKARLANIDAQHRISREICQDEPSRIDQTDVFFPSQRGRLKLRIFNNQYGELIFYERPDQFGPKTSNYSIVPTDKPTKLRAALANANGELAVVKKVRWLYLFDRTRIHLDEVESLGSFLELEVVLQEDESAEDGEKIAADLMGRLEIETSDLVDCAYVDLLLKNA